MVRILDGNSEHVAQAWLKICIFGGKKIRFVTALDLIKCNCAHISELPTIISTMALTKEKGRKKEEMQV